MAEPHPAHFQRLPSENRADIVPLDKLESRYIRHVVQLLNYDIAGAAEKLGVSQEIISAALKDETANA